MALIFQVASATWNWNLHHFTAIKLTLRSSFNKTHNSPKKTQVQHLEFECVLMLLPSLRPLVHPWVKVDKSVAALVATSTWDPNGRGCVSGRGRVVVSIISVMKIH